MPKQILVPRPPIQLKNFASSKLQGLTVADFKYSLENQATFPAAVILGKGTTRNPLYYKTKDCYEARSKDTLWRIVSQHTIQAKKTVRTKCVRKLRNGLILALEEHGFDREGRPLSGTGQGLKGTLTLYPKVPILAMNYLSVGDEIGLIVQELMRRNGIPFTGKRPIAPKSRPVPIPSDNDSVWDKLRKKVAATLGYGLGSKD